MKKNVLKRMIGMTAAVAVSMALLAGCGQDSGTEDVEISAQTTESNTQSDMTDSQSNTGIQSMGSQEAELEVHFGDDGEAFLMHLEDNETAQAIAGYVGTSDWRLPVYERDDDVDYSVVQYYDIPSRYEIPSNPETITEAKVGDVFYSDPNRIVLFYQDAEISEEYTKIGTFDATEEFVTAVAENPVLEGWGNKIILISQP